MAVDGKTTITWYGHACVEVTSPGGRTILIDPWFGNPLSPRTADSVTSCDVLLVTHGHGDHMGDGVALASRLRPVWPCIHEMSLWLARRLPGGAGSDRARAGSGAGRACPPTIGTCPPSASPRTLRTSTGPS